MNFLLLFQAPLCRSTNLIFVVPFSWLMQCSSLSVFALHPLYLRVEAISENIPEDIKVFSLVFIMLHLCKTPFFVGSAEQWKFHFYILNLCDYFSTHSQQEIREARVQLDKKVFTKFFDFESAFTVCRAQRNSNHLNCCFYTSSLLQPIPFRSPSYEVFHTAKLIS